MKKIFFKLTFIATAIFSNYVQAEPTELPEHSTELTQPQANEDSDTITGVNYESDENGNFARLRSVGEAELDIGDRKDIRMAIQKAQLRAKASIAKFLTERVTSDEVMENLEKKATKTDGNTKQVSRETIENYTETIKTSADTLLQGVIVLKTDVNKDEKYVQVEIGLSPKTMAAANNVKGALQQNLGSSSTENNLNNSGYSEKLETGTGREIKKAKNYDSF